jgi:hypothetical protein
LFPLEKDFEYEEIKRRFSTSHGFKGRFPDLPLSQTVDGCKTHLQLQSVRSYVIPRKTREPLMGLACGKSVKVGNAGRLSCVV